MRRPWRRLLLAAGFFVIVSAAPASAQTVVVRNGPPGSSIELSFNGNLIPAMSTGPGEATFALIAVNQKAETDIRVVIDVCGALRRVFVDEAGRSLGVRDVANVLGVPILTSVSVRASTARTVDAGVLPTRLPDSLARPARELLQRIGCLGREEAA